MDWFQNNFPFGRNCSKVWASRSEEEYTACCLKKKVNKKFEKSSTRGL